MYKLDYNIRIGGYELVSLEKVTVTRNVENLTDTAVIELPSARYNRSLNYDSQIKTGDAVEVKLGYDGKLQAEFQGYVSEVSTDGGAVKIMCEDSLYLFKVPVEGAELKSASLKSILNLVVAAVNAASGKSITLSCDYDFTYDKFVIASMTGYDILKKIQDEAKPNIYFKGEVLHVHPCYSEVFGTAQYDFASNIDRDGTDLHYKKAEDRKLFVEAKGKNKKGEEVTATAGERGGICETINFSGVSDAKSLQKVADEAVKAKVYTGYDGSFTGWLLPYCDAGYRVELRDDEAEYKNGAYYATAVEVEFSSGGGKRKVTLGKKLGDVE